MSTIIDGLFEDTNEFFLDWQQWQAEVIAALELVSIASFARAELDSGDFWSASPVRMRDWELFTEAAARLSLAALASPDVIRTHERFMQAIASIEVLLLSNFIKFVSFLNVLNFLSGESSSYKFTGSRGRHISTLAGFENHQTDPAL
jgi:hypothetical protein